MSVDRKNIKGKAQTKVVKSYSDKKKSEKINASQCELCGGCLGTTESYEIGRAHV